MFLFTFFFLQEHDHYYCWVLYYLLGNKTCNLHYYHTAIRCPHPDTSDDTYAVTTSDEQKNWSDLIHYIKTYGLCECVLHPVPTITVIKDMANSFTIKVVNLISNTCVECNRTFDMTNEIESNEWSFGHDCEV